MNKLHTVLMIVLIAVLVMLAGCNHKFSAMAIAQEPINKSAWLAYWDIEAGEKDLAKIGGTLKKLSYFAAYFDNNDHLFVPKELSEKKSELKKKKESYVTYLTFVNDRENSDESLIMKDIEVLRRIFSDDTVMDKHINDIITMTLQGGYDGIEIDYERIWKDKKVGQSFLRLVDRLYVQAMKKGLKLRIILEPGTPFATAAFPKGPEYVVMLYNLKGLHSEPGPKADEAFIKKIITQMEALPGEKAVAFATGGCEWGDNGKKRFLTEVEAKSLAVQYDSTPERNEESRCMVFDYTDNGVVYQVWYADATTLSYWISVARAEGVHNISLWRLGGNVNMNKIE